MNETCSDCQIASGTIKKIRKFYCGSCWIQHCNSRFRKRVFEYVKYIKGIKPKDAATSKAKATGTEDTTKRIVLTVCHNLDNVQYLVSFLKDTVSYHVDAESSVTERCGKIPFPLSFKFAYIFDEFTTSCDHVAIDDVIQTLKFLIEQLQDAFTKYPDYFYPTFYISSLAMSTSILRKFPNTTFHEFDDLFYSVDVTSSLDETSILKQFSVHTEHTENILKDLLLNLSSKTSRSDFMRVLRRRLIITLAKESELETIFLPEHQTSLAISLFSLMSTGRGGQVADEMNLISSNHGGVDLVRPMIDLSVEDLKDYQKVIQDDLSANKRKISPGKIDSIQDQCKEFIGTLQRDYPGTVPTLRKIGSKMEPCNSEKSLESGKNFNIKNEEMKCRFCQSSILKNTKENIYSLCYGCLLILKDCKSSNILEEFFKS